MKKISLFLIVLFITTAINNHALSMECVTIGDVGNDADSTGYGSVGHAYQISKYEVTTVEYVEFLNAIAQADSHSLYYTGMSGSTYYDGITRSGSYGSYTYSANTGWENKPVVYVTWFSTLRFTNWLHNGKPTGTQDSTTTEDGAYDMSLGAGVVRKDGANYWLPSEYEWYKAAYYDPFSQIYYNYATGTDTTPDNNAPVSDTGNSANYYSYNTGYSVGSPYYSTDVGAYGLSASPYGTYDQSGNVYEWTETAVGTVGRVLRGGAWGFGDTTLSADLRNGDNQSAMNVSRGFRVAQAVPEPGAMALSALGLVWLLKLKKRI